MTDEELTAYRGCLAAFGKDASGMSDSELEQAVLHISSFAQHLDQRADEAGRIVQALLPKTSEPTS